MVGQLPPRCTREIGARSGEMTSLSALGNDYDSLGQFQRAIDYHQQDLEIAREIGNRQWEGTSLGGLGQAYNSLGQYQKAIEYHQQALDITTWKVRQNSLMNCQRRSLLN